CNKKLAQNEKTIKIINNTLNPYITFYDDDSFTKEDWSTKIIKHFNASSLNTLGLQGKMYSILSVGKLLDYLYETQKDSLKHISTIEYYDPQEYMILDINTRINLEIHETIINRNRKGALIWLLDKTSTAMGGRLLKNWLEQPLLNIAEIKKRQEIVELLVSNVVLMDKIKNCLDKIYDLERLTSKISYGNCNARDLYSLKLSIENIPELKDLLIQSGENKLINLGTNIDTLNDIYELIDKSI